MKFESIQHNVKFPMILIFFISTSKSIKGYLGSESLKYFNNGHEKGRMDDHIIESFQSFPLTKYLEKFVSKKQFLKLCRYK